MLLPGCGGLHRRGLLDKAEVGELLHPAELLLAAGLRGPGPVLALAGPQPQPLVDGHHQPHQPGPDLHTDCVMYCVTSLTMCGMTMIC